MSRIGRKPVTVPAGVDVKIDAENCVTVKGAKGTLTQKFNPNMKITVENGVLTVERPDDEKQNRALHGLTRSIIANMVEGVTNGYSKKLEINGVGYRAAKQGKQLVLNGTQCTSRNVIVLGKFSQISTLTLYALLQLVQLPLFLRQEHVAIVYQALKLLREVITNLLVYYFYQLVRETDRAYIALLHWVSLLCSFV